jgi:hypothetical protein
MPNAIKYSTSAQTLALKKGNFWIGTGDVGKGPTSVTDYYNGITPPSGGYTIYLNKASGGPSIYTAANDSQLISLSNTIAGQTFATAAAALTWFATQTDKMVFNRDYEGIITNGLIFSVDGGFTPSYPATGNTWYDLTGGNNPSLINGTSFSSNNGGILVFDGVDDYTTVNTSNISFTTQGTISFWMLADAVESYRNPLQINGGSIRFEEYSPGDTFHGGFLAWNGTDRLRYLPYPETLTQGAWYNVVLTWDTTIGKAVGYLNNSLKFNETLTGSMPTTISQVYIGFGFGMDRVWKGKIANTFLYNRALTQAEITQNYNAQKGRFGL